MRTPRSTSRLSMSSKHGAASRASDEDTKTAVKVGAFFFVLFCFVFFFFFFFSLFSLTLGEYTTIIILTDQPSECARP